MRVCASSKIIVLLIGFSAAILVGAGGAKADFIFGNPRNLGPVVNSSSNEHPAGMTADGLSLYFSSRRPGGYSEWYDIYVSTRPTKDDPWEEPVNLGPAINTVNSDFEPDITPDGLILVFVRIGTVVPNWDIWMSTRPTTDDPWGQRVNLGPTINSYVEDMDPCISADGLTLYFSSRRPGGHGESDIWMTTRPTRNDPWVEPVNLGPPVNSSSGDACSHISADGRILLFYSRRPGGYGDADFWMTRRPTVDHPWSEPVNLGPVINTGGSEAYAHISPDGQWLYFWSDRLGGQGGFDIWQAPIVPIVDFNGDGIVNSTDMCIMIDHWGTNEPLCDIGPTPLGDGIVDVQDLTVLAEHLFEEVPEVPPPGLLAHWKFDETEGFEAQNSVGLQNGFLFGDPIWHPAGGKKNGALELDGIDDYVITDSVLNPSDGAFGVFAWIKGGASGQVIMSQADTLVDSTSRPKVVAGSTWLGVDASSGTFMTGLGQIPYVLLVSESVITDDQWHHIGLVYDVIDSRRRLYVDGIEVAADADPANNLPCEAGLYIGSGQSLEPTSFFSGLIDDVRIYHVALSAEEIVNLSP